MDCKNCKTELLSNNTYCPDCGGKIIRNRLTFKNLFASFSEQFLNYDNKFLQTFKTLFTKPEDVIGGYINGIRKKYVNVISYFAIAITLSGLQIYIMQKFPVDLNAYVDPNPEIAEIQKKFNDSLFKTISEYQSLIMMLYIPLYALIARLIFFKNKALNFTETMVVFMYAQAQISILISVLTIIMIPLGVSMMFLGFIIIPVQIFYFAYCLKRVYKLSTAQIILKTLLLLFLFGGIIIIIGIGAGFYMAKTGAFDAMIEAQKSAIETQKAVQDSIN